VGEFAHVEKYSIVTLWYMEYGTDFPEYLLSSVCEAKKEKRIQLLLLIWNRALTFQSICLSCQEYLPGICLVSALQVCVCVCVCTHIHISTYTGEPRPQSQLGGEPRHEKSEQVERSQIRAASPLRDGASVLN
jgi:hypothetical protein